MLLLCVNTSKPQYDLLNMVKRLNVLVGTTALLRHFPSKIKTHAITPSKTSITLTNVFTNKENVTSFEKIIQISK